MTNEFRPDPDSLLKAIQRDETQRRGGQLRIFFGMAAGVGKTFRMLQIARAKVVEGVDVVIGTVDTHGRQETEALVCDLPILARKKIDYKGAVLDEMDLDAVLARRPQIVLVDELAHTNAPGSRHTKRYQDVLELLESGIDVYTTLNVQHLESRKEAIERISGVAIRETVPDSILERAAQIELVDLSPGDLLRRLKEGKIYLGERGQTAQMNFFKEGPLTALREIALRITAERVDQDLRHYMETTQTEGPWKATERLMVAVSHSPYSERLIRATRGLAYNLEAPWIAVNIDTGSTLDELDQAQLMKNLALVRELGGELVTLTETDVPMALRKIARQKNVTQVIVGRPTRRWLKDLFDGGSLLDRLVRESGEFDVHVVRQATREGARAAWWKRPGFQSPFDDYWKVFWAVVGISVFNAAIESYVGYKAVGFVFLLGVLGVSLFCSMGPILLGAASSALIWDYLFIPPRLAFVISEKEDLIMVAMYFVAAITTGLLTNKIRFHEKLLGEREERTALLYEIVSDIVRSSGRTQFVSSICERVGKVLHGECAVLLPTAAAKLAPFAARMQVFAASEKERAVAEWVFGSGRRAGWSTETLAGAEGLYVPLKGRGAPVGVLAYRPNARTKLGIDRENLLSTVATQLAISIERESFAETARESQRLQESEKLHQTLLNSVSHELRTPLTSIIGNATTLVETIAVDDRRRDLASEVVHAGERLNRVVENILDMTRLSAGALSLKKEWNDLGDVASVVVGKLGRAQGRRRISIKADPQLELVEFDFRLVEHMLANLVFNALAYTPDESQILIQAWPTGHRVHLTVEDTGPGVPGADLERIFEKFYRAAGAPAGGTGLGLAIVKNIVELHGGTIRAENVEPHGLKIAMTFPRGTPPRIEEVE